MRRAGVVFVCVCGGVQDLGGYVIVPGATVDALKAACNAAPSCQGFTSAGSLKSSVAWVSGGAAMDLYLKYKYKYKIYL